MNTKEYTVCKTVEDIPEKLFHGTSSDCINSLKEGIILNKGNKKADFGGGFYLTGNYEQAKNWAISKYKASIENTGEQDIKPVIICYDLNLVLLEKLKCAFFTETNLEWAKFVYSNRAEDIKLPHNQDRRYDFVYGPLADGSQITLLISKVKRGEIGLDNFYKEIIGYKYPFPRDHQMSVHSTAAVDTLTFHNIEEVNHYAKHKSYS